MTLHSASSLHLLTFEGEAFFDHTPKIIPNLYYAYIYISGHLPPASRISKPLNLSGYNSVTVTASLADFSSDLQWRKQHWGDLQCVIGRINRSWSEDVNTTQLPSISGVTSYVSYILVVNCESVLFCTHHLKPQAAKVQLKHIKTQVISQVPFTHAPPEPGGPGPSSRWQ